MTGVRLALSTTLVLGGLFSPVAAEAQQAAKIARIGYLAANLAGTPLASHEAFLQGLRDLGYVEGRNVVIEYRDAEGKDERLPALAAELVALKVDVIVAVSTRGCPSLPPRSSASAWNNSSTPSQRPVGSLSSGSQGATANARNRTC